MNAILLAALLLATPVDDDSGIAAPPSDQDICLDDSVDLQLGNACAADARIYWDGYLNIESAGTILVNNAIDFSGNFTQSGGTVDLTGTSTSITGTFKTTKSTQVGYAGVAASTDTVTSKVLIIGVTDTTAPRTVTLKTASALAGYLVWVKDQSGAAGTNNITVDTEAAQTIDGAATYVISTNYGRVLLYSNGTNWFILAAG